MASSGLEPGSPHEHPEETWHHGRLTFRPRPPRQEDGPSGRTAVAGPDGHPAGLAYVPASAAPGPRRLVVMLHGAGGDAGQALDLLRPLADRAGLLLLAPKSQGPTWDVIVDGYGPDVAVLDHLLGEVADRHLVGSVAVGGFSDGASYALSLGIANGDLFDAVVAFSPGFSAALVRHGRPRMFLSHGTADPVLPVDRCSRRLVPQLLGQGYDVTYHEFRGGHLVPTAVVEEAVGWLEEGAG